VETLKIYKSKKLIYISNNLDKRERLVLNYFLSFVRNTKPNTKEYYTTTLSNIGTLFNIKDYRNAVIKILKKFVEYTMTINIIKKVETVASFISDLHFLDKGVIKVKFSDTFINLAKTKRNYTIIDLVKQTQLSSKFSLIMYEIILDYTLIDKKGNKKNEYLTIPEYDLNTFKAIMGLEDKYISMYQLKNNILEKSKQDLKKIDIDLDYEIILKSGFECLKFSFCIGDRYFSSSLTNEQKRIQNQQTSLNEERKKNKELEKEIRHLKYKNEQLLDYMDGMNQKMEDSKN